MFKNKLMSPKISQWVQNFVNEYEIMSMSTKSCQWVQNFFNEYENFLMSTDLHFCTHWKISCTHWILSYRWTRTYRHLWFFANFGDYHSSKRSSIGAKVLPEGFHSSGSTFLFWNLKSHVDDVIIRLTLFYMPII